MVSSSERHLRRGVLRTKREYVNLDPKVLPRITSLNDSPRLTDSLNNLMDVIIKRCQSAGISLDSSNPVEGWEWRLQEAVRLRKSGESLSPDTRTLFDQAFSSPKCTLNRGFVYLES